MARLLESELAKLSKQLATQAVAGHNWKKLGNYGDIF